MCGIAGQWNFAPDQPVDPHRLRAMVGKLYHRGPDSEGFYSEGPVGLGVRRLRIIDLNTGDMPISNEDKTVWVVFNGEIYNFLELRPELEKRGHVFRTRSDTEVIVHAYEEHGLDFVNHFNGMFAIALWDLKNRRLVLARDRLGVKPLFYSLDSRGCQFASELKALLAGGIDRTIDLQALSDYFSYNYVPSPRSIFRDAKKVPPGHLLVLTASGSELRRYWDISFSPDAPRSEEECVEGLRDLLRSSVRYRLISDVPLGVFLSGGVDSGAVVATMREVGAGAIRTFSIGFRESSFNELEEARLVARRYETEHHEFVVEGMPADTLRQMAYYLDEPLADSAAIACYYVSRLARSLVTVALGGDGGDELFAGYQTYAAYKYSRAYQKLPPLLRDKLVPYVVNHLPVSHRRVSFDYKAKRFVKGADHDYQRAHFMWKVAFTEPMKLRLFKRDFHEELSSSVVESFQAMKEHFLEARSPEPLDQLQYVDIKMYLTDNNLARLDRMSMAHSLEAREPLLDYRIAEYAAKIPASLRMKGFRKKHLLRKALRGRLPDRILRGRKKGFNVAMPGWLGTVFRDLVLDLLGSQSLRAQGFFDADYVGELVRQHFAREVDQSRLIWELVIFLLWWEQVRCPQ